MRVPKRLISSDQLKIPSAAALAIDFLIYLGQEDFVS